MCGIAGYYHHPHWENAKLAAMVGAIRHRGPDGDGFYFHPQRGVGLGHARLSILDLSPMGRQPMTIPGSGCWIVYNGEIYNFIELRRELSQKKYRFRSDTDTEVLLSAWLEWGEDAFSRFNGMWALAIYDETADSLILCRDRYGVKPLYYHLDGGRLAFGSEYKAFLPVMDALGVDWDPRGLRTALADPFRLESSGCSLFEGISNLPPGHLLRIQGESCTVRRWWDTREHVRPTPPDLASQAEEFKALFESSCSLRMRSDVPVGTSLSGGLDSSSVAVVMASLSAGAEGQERWPEDRRKTFVHSFPGTPLDETEYAEAASAAAGVQPICVVADPRDLADRLDETLYALEGIYIGMPDSAWRIYRAQRAHGVIVSLDGHGADEMLGGYDWHVNALLRDTPLCSRSFWRLLRHRSDMLCGLTSGRQESSIAKYAHMAASAAALAAKKALNTQQPLLPPRHLFVRRRPVYRDVSADRNRGRERVFRTHGLQRFPPSHPAADPEELRPHVYGARRGNPHALPRLSVGQFLFQPAGAQQGQGRLHQSDSAGSHERTAARPRAPEAAESRLQLSAAELAPGTAAAMGRGLSERPGHGLPADRPQETAQVLRGQGPDEPLELVGGNGLLEASERAETDSNPERQTRGNRGGTPRRHELSNRKNHHLLPGVPGRLLRPERGDHTRPFGEQYSHLMAQAFANADFYATHLRALGVDAYEIIANADPLQHAWAREHDTSPPGRAC